jgi:uncharacterized protein (TIGR00369 family)
MVRELGAVCTEVGERSATFVIPQTPMVPNPNGSVNGGIVVAIADQMMGLLAARTAARGHLHATGTLSAQFHSPAVAPLTVVGTLVRNGRRLAFVEVVVTDRNGARCTSCQGTMVAGGAMRPADQE